MRTIEFRGKNQSGVWLYGDLQQHGNAIDTDGIDLGGNTFIEPHEYGDEVYSPDYYAVNPDTVGQYTGLNDARGKKIFEGDIIIICGPYGDGSMGTAKIGEHAMLPGGELYNYGAYLDFFYEPGRAKGMRRQELLFWTREHDVKVIGNIHDNPELLKT